MNGRDAAVAAARRGAYVFPCVPGDKPPAVTRWEDRACSDLERVARFWPSEAHNVGVACGPSGLAVIDLDCHAELPGDWRSIPGVRDGADVFACLLEWAGESRWPATTWTQTPSGGYHLWFGQPKRQPAIRNSAGLLGPGIDVRGAGGYVLAPGSVVGGRAYEMLDDSPPAPLPGWLARRLAPRPPERRPVPAGSGPANLSGLVSTVRAAEPPQQTDTLVWAAFRLREEIDRGRAAPGDGEHLVQAGLDAGMRPETYVRYQVRHVLEASR